MAEIKFAEAVTLAESVHLRQPSAICQIQIAEAATLAKSIHLRQTRTATHIK